MVSFFSPLSLALCWPHRLMRGQIVHSRKLRQFWLLSTRRIWHVFMLIHNGHTTWPKLAKGSGNLPRKRKHNESMPEAMLWFTHSSLACPTHCQPVSLCKRERESSQRKRERVSCSWPHFSRCAGKQFVQFMKSY